jgi:hypothetical protein
MMMNYLSIGCLSMYSNDDELLSVGCLSVYINDDELFVSWLPEHVFQ